MPSQLWPISAILKALEQDNAVMVEAGPPMEAQTLRTIKEAVDFFACNAMYGNRQYEYPCILIPQETTRVIMTVRTPGTVDVQKLLIAAIESKHGEVIEWGNEE